MKSLSKLDQNKYYIEVSSNGSFKLSGSQRFVNSKYEELTRKFEEKKELHKELVEERCTIALILLLVVLIILFLIFISGFSMFPIKDYWMIFSAGIVGSAFRAGFLGKDIKADKTPKDLRLAYYFIYPVVIFATTFLILSGFNSLGYESWVFYAASIPTSFFTGIMGLAIIAKIISIPGV